MELTANNEKKAREKPSNISSGRKVLNAGCVAVRHVLQSCHVKEISPILISRSDDHHENHENLLTAKKFLVLRYSCTTLHWLLYTNCEVAYTWRIMLEGNDTPIII